MTIPLKDMHKVDDAHLNDEVAKVIAGLKNERNVAVATIALQSGRSDAEVLAMIRMGIESTGGAVSAEPVKISA